MSENGGKALMGTGYANGAGRGVEAAKSAITSPLLEDISIDGAKGILLNVTASPDFGVEELDEACRYIKEQAHDGVNLIFGLVIDKDANDSVRITVIATGIDSSYNSRNSNIITELPQREIVPEDEFEIPAFIRKKKTIKEQRETVRAILQNWSECLIPLKCPFLF